MEPCAANIHEGCATSTVLAWLLGITVLLGIFHMLYAARLVVLLRRRRAPLGQAEPATLMKPLHGAEPKLAENLVSFIVQAWDAPIQMVVGVQRDDDAALDVLSRLDASAGPAGSTIAVVVDPTRHGANAKIGNLINMLPAARHDLIVLSDSDMAVPRDYLAVLAGALSQPGVGAATCLYRGRGDMGRWSQLAAAGISYHFLPQLLTGLALGLAKPGMGSTIALHRSVLDRIGGFEPFATDLADDYAMGEAVRALGLAVTVPPMLLVHGCSETSFGALWRHELRWAATIRRINLPGHIGTFITYPLPLALLLLPLAPAPGAALLVMALAARLVLRRAVDRIAAARTAPAWMLPARDCLSFGVFLASFVVRSVDWRGQRLTMTSKRRIAAATESRGS